MAKIRIEEQGGLAGLGDVASALSRVGELDDLSLPVDQKQAIDSLFLQKSKTKLIGADRILYKLSRENAGEFQTILVAERDLPVLLRAALSFEFR